jgi:hypothetical protein
MKNKNKVKRSIRIEAISKIGFLLKVKAGPSFNPPRKHHGISDRHTQVCRGLETRA